MRVIICCAALFLFSFVQLAVGQDSDFETIKFDSADGVQITADLYMPHDDQSPFVVLCHQAGWSRGEYREIAPKLNELGFNCLAIDQRSGKAINDVKNETMAAASDAGKGTEYADAEQDIVAALKYARENYAKGNLLVWGSSYSAALVIRVTGENSDLVNGALSFAPGEYFGRAGKPADWIATSAKKIEVPVFITSAKNEYRNWSSIYDAIEVEGKQKFLPQTAGNHGSRALWEKFDDSGDYWAAVEAFLQPYLER